MQAALKGIEAERAALYAVIAAVNAVGGEMVHWKVREAITKANETLVESQCRVEAIFQAQKSAS